MTDAGPRLGDNGRSMTDQPYPNRLDEWMSRRNANGAALGRLIGTSKQHISMLRNGERELTLKWAATLAPELGVAWHELLILPTHPPAEADPAVVARFAAAVLALYGDDHVKAAADVSLQVADLQAIIEGKRVLTYALMLRFCEASGCPTDWLLRGRLTAMFPEWAMVRLLTLTPDLVADQSAAQPVSA